MDSRRDELIAEVNANSSLCILCHASIKSIPSQYFCYCGKVNNPIRKIGVLPHSCGGTCGKKRKGICPHPCPLKCHPGPCPPCSHKVTVSCFCGKQSRIVGCDSGNVAFSCGSSCDRLLPYGYNRSTPSYHPPPSHSSSTTISSSTSPPSTNFYSSSSSSSYSYSSSASPLRHPTALANKKDRRKCEGYSECSVARPTSSSNSPKYSVFTNYPHTPSSPSPSSS
ncbi:uncharacterized protein MONOS_17040 [Monocercomonoides exilis]|uniref:uncharacterized protein n=1 Tax=Monocercomonoides exilis TaxID=2049356 RepID=UPI00355A5B85|nr:hypothetical protein MONOS_17040 [Monocercomonoides exilis]